MTALVTLLVSRHLDFTRDCTHDFSSLTLPRGQFSISTSSISIELIGRRKSHVKDPCERRKIHFHVVSVWKSEHLNLDIVGKKSQVKDLGERERERDREEEPLESSL